MLCMKDRFRDPPLAVSSLPFCFMKTSKKSLISEQFQVPGEMDRKAQRFPVADPTPARPMPTEPRPRQPAPRAVVCCGW